MRPGGFSAGVFLHISAPCFIDLFRSGGITMTDDKLQLPHKLILDQRKHLTVTGVTEVVSFEEDGAVLKTVQGTLIIQGQQLKLKTLSLEGGQVDVSGTVIALHYEQPRAGGLRRLFG
jgi:sporulation protein YabP